MLQRRGYKMVKDNQQILLYITMEVAETATLIEIDLYNFNNYYSNNQRFHQSAFDFHVSTEYVDEHNFLVIVRRLDSDSGWHHDLDVLANFVLPSTKSNTIIKIGPSDKSEKTVSVHVDFVIRQYSSFLKLPTYTLASHDEPKATPRETFNQLFKTDIVCLPPELYAVGLHDKTIFMYNSQYASYFEIIRCIFHIIKVAMTFTKHDHFYFIISSQDGYMMHNYLNNRTTPKRVLEHEYTDGKTQIIMENDNEYPVFHSGLYILGQSTHIGFPYALGIPDRHYFYCDLYNPFRSFHQGIPFYDKINKVVYASRRDRGTKFNYAERRDINVNQREYLYASDLASNPNIVLAQKWMNDHLMVKYRYILDIDGMASTWDATAWKMNSGSVIFKVKSCWRQWFYDEYLPWVHYIPIADDFSDLLEKYEWCESNQDKCLEIVSNAKQLFQKVYRYNNVAKYTVEVLNTIYAQQNTN